MSARCRAHVHEAFAADRFDEFDCRLRWRCRVGSVRSRDRIPRDACPRRSRRRDAFARQAASCAQSATSRPHLPRRPPSSACNRPRNRFIGGLPRKPATNRFTGCSYMLHRRIDLLNDALVHHDDALTQCHRLDLIVRDVDHRRLELTMQPRDLRAHRAAQLRIEIRQRLVEQKHLRMRTSARPSATRWR